MRLLSLSNISRWAVRNSAIFPLSMFKYAHLVSRLIPMLLSISSIFKLVYCYHQSKKSAMLFCSFREWQREEINLSWRHRQPLFGYLDPACSVCKSPALGFLLHNWGKGIIHSHRHLIASLIQKPVLKTSFPLDSIILFLVVSFIET